MLLRWFSCSSFPVSCHCWSCAALSMKQFPAPHSHHHHHCRLSYTAAPSPASLRDPPQLPPQHRPLRAPRKQSPSTPQEHRPRGTLPEIVTGLSSVSFLMPSLVLVPTENLAGLPEYPRTFAPGAAPRHPPQGHPSTPTRQTPRRPPGPPPSPARHLYPPGAPGSDLPP